MEFAELSTAVTAVRAKKISAAELAQEYLARARERGAEIGAFISLNDKAVDKARQIDHLIAKGQDPGPLAGACLGIKDLLCTDGLRTTAGSRMLEKFVPPYSATVVARLESAGAVTIGKTNLDEFAMGSSNEQSAFGPCRNPWDSTRVAGGSSGGSAAAVAAELVMAAIGTDTGGSIRQPAAFCGVVGVKPTYGRVSRYGIIAFASSLDQAGPMTKSVRDSALLLEVICGQDALDTTSSAQNVPRFVQQLKPQTRGLKVGLLKEYLSGGVDAAITKALERATAELRSRGAEIVEVSVPLTAMAVPIYYLVATSEASSNLSRYDGVRYGFRADFAEKPPEDLAEFYSRSRGQGFGAEVKRRIMLGTYALSSGYYDAYFRKACQVRRLLHDQFVAAFQSCDVILGPVTPTTAFKIGANIKDPLQMYLSDIFTTATNLAGLPGMSVPAGFDDQGLPVGLQVMAGHFQEQTMLNVGAALEEIFGQSGSPGRG